MNSIPHWLHMGKPWLKRFLEKARFELEPALSESDVVRIATWLRRCELDAKERILYCDSEFVVKVLTTTHVDQMFNSWIVAVMGFKPVFIVDKLKANKSDPNAGKTPGYNPHQAKNRQQKTKSMWEDV